MKKSVVMVCSQYPPTYGGAGKQAQLVSKTLCARGWDVTVVSLDQDGVGRGQEDGVRVTRLLKGIAATSTVRRVLTTVVLGLAAAWIILLKRPQAVHVHGAYWWSIPPVLAGRLVSSTTVVKITRDGEDDPETVFRRKLLGVVPVGWLYGLSLSAADFVVVLSNDALDNAQSYLPADGLRLIRNGVDREALQRTPHRRRTARESLGIVHDAEITTFVGYLVEHKGVLDLLAAWRLRENALDNHLWLVGPYDGYYRELSSAVLDEVRAMQSEGYKIRLFGHVAPEIMPKIYWATDIFALPSYAEGMPNSLAEAIVAGCSIVGTEIPGISDIVDSESAFLVTPGDVQALSGALDKALFSPQKLSHNSNEAIGIERTTKLLEELYVSAS